MIETGRKISEIIAIAKLEPTLKTIYVEGESDYYFLENYQKHHHIEGTSIYLIDLVDFKEEYEKMDEEQIKFYQSNNKERLILLAKIIESKTTKEIPFLCVVDRDFDDVTNNVRTGKYLSYTDYNSMEMYLCNEETIEKYLVQGIRCRTLNIKNLLDSLSLVGRQIFHIHLIVHENQKARVDNDKSFHIDKETQTCSLNLEDYWNKTIQKAGLTAHNKDLRDKFDAGMQKECDPRMEIRGHDFVHYLFIAAKKIKSKLDMSEVEFANVFWQYADFEKLASEQLFQRISSL